MVFSFQNAFRNNTIICNEAREVDLDALNMLASGGNEALCTCGYRSEKGHHHFVYDTLGMIPLPQVLPKLDYQLTLELLDTLLSLINAAESGVIALENLKIAKEYIFREENGFRFIYIPIAAKKGVRSKDVILRLLSLIRQKDPRIQQLTRDLRKAAEDVQATDCLRKFVNSFGLGMDMAQAEAETTALSGQSSYHDAEGETTALSQVRDAAPVEFFAPYGNDDTEGETTALSQNGFGIPGGFAAPYGGSDVEGENTVLSQARDAAPAGFFASCGSEDAEGETAVLFQAGYGASQGYAADAEGETTALNQSEYTQDGEANRMTVFYADESAEMETMILTSEPELPWAERLATIDGKYRFLLLNNQNGELVPVEVTPFTIGKDRFNMDYTVDNDSVSRHHATVVHEDGTYYIIDNHSTNGTRVEGIRLQPGEKAELEHGYMITLGRATFQAVLERR